MPVDTNIKQIRITSFLLIITFFTFGFRGISIQESSPLFHISRSRDSDIIQYDLNLSTNGQINTKKPINIYWIRKTRGGKKEALSYMQDNFAYGVKYISTQPNEVKFQFVSYSKRTFIIKKMNGGKYKLITYFDNKGVELERIYVQFGGGTFNLPKISFINMYWQDLYIENAGVETIIP